jgi:fructose-1,6-bisphosphatase/inositol monophosphatase family enzyme
MVGGAATLRMLGSASMDATAVAQGRFHVRCQHSMPPWDDLPGAALVLGAGGAVRRVRAGGVEWSAAGVPTAVAELSDRLLAAG